VIRYCGQVGYRHHRTNKSKGGNRYAVVSIVVMQNMVQVPKCLLSAAHCGGW
jgi:hypothetical protein